jgi:hypothetical protein
MLNLALVIFVLADMFILLAIIGTLGFWMKGEGSLAFPGLGLIFATPLLLILLIIVEVIMVICTAYLVRYIPIVRELLG